MAAGTRPGDVCAAWVILGAAACPCRLLAGSRPPCHLQLGPVYESTLLERGFEQRDKHLVPASKNVFTGQALRAHVLPSPTRHCMCAPVPQTWQRVVKIFIYILEVDAACGSSCAPLCGVPAASEAFIISSADSQATSPFLMSSPRSKSVSSSPATHTCSPVSGQGTLGQHVKHTQKSRTGVEKVHSAIIWLPGAMGPSKLLCWNAEKLLHPSRAMKQGHSTAWRHIPSPWAAVL